MLELVIVIPLVILFIIFVVIPVVLFRGEPDLYERYLLRVIKILFKLFVIIGAISVAIILTVMKKQGITL